MTETRIKPDYTELTAEKVVITQLLLHHFRSYPSLSLALDGSPVVLTGPNGAGKTNILEAISFLAPGRGMRSAKLTDIDTVSDNASLPWVVSSKLSVGSDEHHVGTGRDPGSLLRAKRVVHVNATQNVPQSELANVCTVMWQTPQMDGLFLSGASDRRRFLDRMVYHFDPLHAKRVNQYEHAMRERMRLLQEQGDLQWIAVLEQRMASEAVAIAVARNETLAIVRDAIACAPSAFPKAILEIDGEIESKLLSDVAALSVEEAFQALLKEQRMHDMRSGRTQKGVHRSDLLVSHNEKYMPASLCSTGEQKALLLSIVLAEARAKALWKNNIPILLLDEVVAHLDKFRREALFEEIVAMGAQVWMTGTDILLFDGLEKNAQFFEVDNSEVRWIKEKEFAR